MLDQCGRHPDRAEEVRGDDVLHRLFVDRLGRVVEGHDTRIVEQHVQRRIVGDDLGRDLFDVRWIGDVHLVGCHAGVRLDGLVKVRLAASRDDHLVAELVEGLGQAASDTGAATRDEDRVASQFHSHSPWV